MHTCIQLDVDGPSRDTLTLSSVNQGIHQTEGVDLGLQVVVEHGLEGRHLRIHNHDVLSDAMTAQSDTLVGYGNSQIIDTMVLQRFSHFDSTSAIGISLDHAYQLSLRLQEGTVVVEVVNYGIEIHLENGLVYLQFQTLSNAVETEETGSLDENYLVVQLTERLATQEVFGSSEEGFLANQEEGGCR